MSYHTHFNKIIVSFCIFFTIAIFSTAQAADKIPKLIVFGDSLTAGYGLEDLDDAFPVKLGAKLKELGANIEIISSGVSGDTSTAANERLLWALGDVKADNIKYAIIELGANDAFRGILPSQTKIALQEIIDKMAAQNIKIILAGMLAPPNMGDDYEAEFALIFKQLAENNDVLFYPFFLDGVAGNLELNQKDGIHPTPEGVDVIIVNIMPSILELIE